MFFQKMVPMATESSDFFLNIVKFHSKLLFTFLFKNFFFLRKRDFLYSFYELPRQQYWCLEQIFGKGV